MKKLILLIALFTAGLAFSQLEVNDASVNAQMAQQLASSGKQLSQLQQTYKVMKDAADKLQQVNGYVQSMGQLQNIINTQKQAINNANACVAKARKYGISLNDVSYNLSVISGTIKTVQALLQNNIFKMSDSERITMLDQQLKKAQTANANIKIKLMYLNY